MSALPPKAHIYPPNLQRPMRPTTPSRMPVHIGSRKYAHHFGLDCFATVAEHLTLQDSLMHSINGVPAPSFALFGASALAAGGTLRGTTCFVGCATDTGSGSSVNLALPEHAARAREMEKQSVAPSSCFIVFLLTQTSPKIRSNCENLRGHTTALVLSRQVKQVWRVINCLIQFRQQLPAFCTKRFHEGILLFFR